LSGRSHARHALHMAFALATLLLTPSTAAAQDPRAGDARPTPAQSGHGQHSDASSARTLAFGAGFHRDCGSGRVREVQRRLRALGYRLGPVDGLFGPRTRSAVRLFQHTLGTRPTGVVSPSTLALLRDRSPLRRRAVRIGSGAGPCGSDRVRTVQRRLRTLGYRPGPVDGQFGPRTRDAVVRFQRDRDLNVDGSIAPATILTALRPDPSHGREQSQPVRQPAAPPADDRVASASFSPPAPGSDELGAMLTGAAVALLGLNALLLLLGRRRPAPPTATDPVPDPAGGTDGDDRSHAAAPEPEALAPGTRVFGYVSVGEHERDADPHAHDAQANEIRDYCNARGLELVRIVQDVEPESGRASPRPGLRYVLEQIALGAASGLVVCELRRLSGSSAALAPLLQWFGEWEAALIALDLDLDTTTTAGDSAARALASLSEWERVRISERTRRGLEEARAQGRTGHRPSVNDLPELSERIQALRAQGMTLQAIADVLNREGVPTVRGGTQWRPSSVQTAVGYRRPIGGTRPVGLPPNGRFARQPEEPGT
jgi:peptidoglycan hydrolase-like protein with peptidoglycan-binding domain/DNA invertase Pin-like site-specific DNA recombinase